MGACRYPGADGQTSATFSPLFILPLMAAPQTGNESLPMKTFRRTLPSLAALLIVLVSSGCSSGPQVDPQITAAVSARHVTGETYGKISNARALDYGDILTLVKAKVPSHITVGYLRSTQRVYNFSYAQLSGLKAAGAKPHLLNYLTETQGFYGNNMPQKAGAKIPKYIRDNSKLNQDQQPFFYNAPLVDDWYDSAYTESCYSPFSFN